MEFVEIKPAGNKSCLQKQTIQPPSSCSGVGAVPLDTAKGSLGLNGAVHAQQGTVNAGKVVQDLLVKVSQLLV